MAKDFKASQVRTTQIIASGSTSGKPSLVILSASSAGASDFSGGGFTAATAGAGRDVFVFVSGSTASKNTAVQGVTLFGGDIMISGTAYGTAGAFAVVAGSDTQVQFNDGGTALGGDSGLTYNKTTDTLTVGGDLAVNGGDLTSTQTTFNLLNSTVTTLNVGGAATAVSIGNSAGTVTVPGNLTVNGTTTTVNTQNLVVKDPIIYFGSSSAAGETTGGIALASGSSTSNQALVFGKVATNTWGTGRFDVQAGQATSMATMTLVPIRSSKFEAGGTGAFVSSSIGTDIIINATSVQVTGTLSQGNDAQASGQHSHAQGTSTIASGEGSHAEGLLTISSGVKSHAEGDTTTASGLAAHSEGTDTTAQGDYSHSEGEFAISEGIASHAEGATTIARGEASHAEGIATLAEGLASHAEGSNTAAVANLSHAEGIYSHASGTYSHAEGYGTIAKSNGSHTEGYQTVTNGDFSHAEGYSTYAGMQGSHTEGYFTTASANYSHAEGYYTIASGSYSHAEGYYTIASGTAQTVVGKYNKRGNEDSLFIVGGGTGDTNSLRKDIFLVNQNTVRIGSASLGNDVVFFVSGNANTENDSTKTVVGGSLVVSGVYKGGYNPDVGLNLIQLVSPLIAVRGGSLGIEVAAADTFLYVSGTVGSKGTSTRGTSVFGGDVVISGTLHGGSPLKVSGSMALSGSLRLQTQDSAPSVGTNESVLYVLNDAGTKKLYWKNSDETQQQVGTGGVASGTFNEVNSGGTISLVTTASVSLAGAKGFNYGVNQVGSDAFFFVSGSLSGRGNSSGEVAVFGGHTVFSGAIYGGVNSDLSRTLLRQEATQIAFSKEDGLTAGNVAGTDVFMFVSGAIGSKDTATRGTTVYGGDIVISGVLHGGSPLQIGSNTEITGTLNQGTGNLVSGNRSVALGLNNNVSGQDSTAIGSYNIIQGDYGFAAGAENKIPALATSAAAIGQRVVASGSVIAVGICNTLDNPNALFVVGNGSNLGGELEEDIRQDILVVDTNMIRLGSGSKAPTDTFLSVYGVPGSKGSATRGTAVFRGDTVVSGVLYSSKISGSLTQLTDGTPYLIAGSNITLTTGTNGAVTIASTGGGTPGGSDTQIQFNDGGSFGGSNGLKYDKNTQTLSVGNLIVTGSTTVLTSTNVTISDQMIYLASGSKVSNTNGGIAITSGSSASNQALVWGRVANDTWGAGRQDVTAGTTSDLTSMTLVPVRSSKFEIGGSSAFVSSSNGSLLEIAASTQVLILSGGNASSSNPKNFTDTNFFVSGSTNSKGTSTMGTAVFGGDVTISGTLYGGVQFGSSTGLTIQANKVQVTANSLSIGQSGGNDVSFFVSGSVGSRGGASPGTALIGGDLVISGSTYIASGNSVFPAIDLGSDLGSPTNRFGNIYTGDLHLRNERGNWTIVEEEDYLCVVNNKTGKKFKMALIPLEE